MEVGFRAFERRQGHAELRQTYAAHGGSEADSFMAGRKLTRIADDIRESPAQGRRNGKAPGAANMGKLGRVTQLAGGTEAGPGRLRVDARAESG
jgi:hypothetical protein